MFIGSSLKHFIFISLGLAGYLSRRLFPRIDTALRKIRLIPHPPDDLRDSNLDWPKVSVIIPTKDKHSFLVEAVNGVRSSCYSNLELIVIDNESVEQETAWYLDALAREGVRVLSFPYRFNYSAMMNMGVQEASGEFVLALNNDTSNFSKNWIQHLVSHVVTDGVGLVGPTLINGDGTIQNHGLILGYLGIAGSLTEKILASKSPTALSILRNCHTADAVSFSCCLIRKSLWELHGGLDERFMVGLNDVDFGLRFTRSGLTNTICSLASVGHLEYGTRSRMSSLKGSTRAIAEVLTFLDKHPRFHKP